MPPEDLDASTSFYVRGSPADLERLVSTPLLRRTAADIEEDSPVPRTPASFDDVHRRHREPGAR
jgi:hypothetical protein